MVFLEGCFLLTSVQKKKLLMAVVSYFPLFCVRYNGGPIEIFVRVFSCTLA